MKERRSFSGRLVNLCYLVGSALLICIVGVGASVITEVRHLSLMWVFLSGISIVFVAFAREEYRKEFRSGRFVLFVCCWLAVNVFVVVVVLGSFGWLCLIVALFLEQIAFYMTAYWLFGLLPPLRARGEQ